MKILNSKEKKNGFSFVELLVVISIFVVISVLGFRSIVLTLRGSRKSESVLAVRENLSYGLSVIERQLRSAESILSACDGTSTTRIDYRDLSGATTYFQCNSIGAQDGHVASGSARLTSSEVSLTACSFVCSEDPSGDSPPSVNVSLSAEDANATGLESAEATVVTKIFLRNN